MNGSLYLWKLFSFLFFFAMFLFSRILRKAFKARSFGNGRSFFFLWIFAFESAAGFLFCFFLFMFMFLSFFLGIPGSPAFFFSFGALESLDCLPGAVFFLWSSLLAHTSVGCWFFFFFFGWLKNGNWDGTVEFDNRFVVFDSLFAIFFHLSLQRPVRND